MPNVVRKLFRIGREDGGWIVYPHVSPSGNRSIIRVASWKAAIEFCCLANQAVDYWLRTNELTVAYEDLIAVLERSVRYLRAERSEIEEYRDILIDEVATLRSIKQIQAGIITILEAKLDGES